MSDSQMKVTADHLRRDAYLYVRQSSLQQVANNTESGRRQYDLRGRAVAVGWPAERVVVIDVDQGQSGSSATDREGIQRLVADVSLQKAGIVLGLECSRLARNNAQCRRRHWAFHADPVLMPTSDQNSPQNRGSSLVEVGIIRGHSSSRKAISVSGAR